ncbi:MAG TPA: 4-(cytidine 5'-diphospho)-2-C-methyl-D-erythritol kinase [Planctomicrobium sp.]|nr:4-(cytidine 5'-diphospho)-2-C-methyl-D-erythritol kinase [Planctomicrobium sp.]
MRLSRQGSSLLVQAPAKLNLSLAVLGRREDGFHQLKTVMLSVRLTDLLRFSPSESGEIELRCHQASRSGTSSLLAVDDRNLVIRAARLLREQTGCSQGVSIDLVKRIPMEAGMGGGSSNAAATLVALNRFWNLGLSSHDLHALAAQLGSDVNFFIDSPVAAVCSGRGEEVEPVPVSGPLHFVIVKPPFGLSTPKVFQQWGELQQDRGEPESVSPQITQTVQELESGRLDRLGESLRNDLTAPAARLDPRLAEILQRLKREDVYGSGMTGSGSACFVLCRNAAQARAIAGRWRHFPYGTVFTVSSGT